MDGYIDVMIYVVIQIIAIGSAACFWYQVYPGKEDRRKLWTGIFLYFICPYRLFYGFLSEEMSGSMWRAIGFSVLPLIFLAMNDFEKKKNQWLAMAGAAVCLIITGYADVRLFLVVAFTVFVISILKKKFFMLFLLGLSVVVVLPGNLSVVRYVFWAKPLDGIQLGSIMPAGYDISNLVRAFVIGDNKPGMGMGLIICLVVLFWNGFVRKKKSETKDTGVYLVTFLVLTFLSLKYCPWDYAQRVAGFMLRGVSYFAYPALFFGVAQVCLSICGTGAICDFYKEEEEKTGTVLWMILLILGLGESMILLANL